MRRIWPGVAATARSSAISRSRCWIDRPIVLATTKIAMNSASPPNDAVTAISVGPRLLELGVLGPAARVAGEHHRAAGGGAQARGVEAGAGEHADRVDAAGMAGQPRRLGVGEEDRRLLPDGVAGAGDADHGDGAGGLGGREAQLRAERGAGSR